MLEVHRHYLSVFKPAYVSSQPPGRHVLQELQQLHPELWDAKPPFCEPKGIHRLDLLVSGVMIFGRSIWASRHLAKQFKDRKVDKLYRARVDPTPTEEEGKIAFSIDGKEALTYWKKKDGQLLDLRPVTGRKRQLREHLARIGCPVVGDTLFNGVQWNGTGIALQCVRMHLYIDRHSIVVECNESDQAALFRDPR